MFQTICIACMIIGLLIPFCSIVLNLFDGFVDFLDIDVFQLDFGGDWCLDFLPLSVNSLCLWSLIFGCFGMIFQNRLPVWLLVVLGLLLGYVFAVALQSAVKRLKKVENFPSDRDEILLRTGKVSNKIPDNGVGAVSILVSTGSNVSYPAKSSDGKAIEQDKEVNVLRFEGDYIIVESTDHLEEKYDRMSDVQ